MPIFQFCPRCGHPLPSVDIASERVLSQTCSACGAVHFKNAKPSVSTVVTREGKVLLARRAHEPFQDWWNLPGGFLDPWEQPAHGAAREVAEETGLVVRPTQIIDVAVYPYGAGGDYILNLFYRADAIGGDLRASDDAADVKWFARDDLPERIAFLHDWAILEVGFVQSNSR